MGGYTDQMGADILRGIGAPVSAANLRRLRAWAKAEGGSASFNPFNTTLSEPGATNYNSFGKNKQYHVRNYPSQAVGEQATINTLLKTGGGAQYRTLVATLRNPNSTDQQFASAIKGSGWGTSGSLVAKILHAPGPVSISTATPSASAGTPQTTSGDTSATVCYWHIPFPGMSTDLCLDNVLWVGMIVGGGLIFLGGAVVVAVSAGVKNPAVKAAAETAAVAFPVGRIAKGVKGVSAARATKQTAAVNKQEAETVAASSPAGKPRESKFRTVEGPETRTTAQIKAANERRNAARARQSVVGTGGKRVATRAEAGF